MHATRFLELVCEHEKELGETMHHVVSKTVDNMLAGASIEIAACDYTFQWVDRMTDYSIRFVLQPQAVIAVQRYLQPRLCEHTYKTWLCPPPPGYKTGTQFLYVALTTAALDARIQNAISDTLLAFSSGKARPVCTLMTSVAFECTPDRVGITFLLMPGVRGLLPQVSVSVIRFMEAHGYLYEYVEATKLNCVYVLRK